MLCLLMLSAAAKSQTNWITKKLDEKLSVKFPTNPETVTKNGVDSYLVKANDSIKYSTTLVDYKLLAKLDSATLAPVKDTQAFADQLRMGIASSKTNYTFGPITVGKWNSYTSYNLTATENTTKSTLLMRMILIGSKMYTLACLVPLNIITQNNEVFFSSVEMTKK